MKSYKNLYPKLCSYNNLEKAFKKARKNKSSMFYVKEFEKNLTDNILQLKKELETFTYKPLPLKKFIIRDPKTRVIRKSCFRDRIVHHAIVNILEPIYEKIFIYDSYANRLNKGTLAALKRFGKFKRKISKNGKLVKNAKNNNMTKGYVLKADIKHFFDSVNHNILMKILKRKIKDNRLIWLVNIILKNFKDKEKGMPLGNMTSQFFANVYLNELDYFIKHKLKIKYYIRYVDDFIILNYSKKVLEEYKIKINEFLKDKLKLELHKDKSRIVALSKGIDFVGFRNFYYFKLLRKRNIKNIITKIEQHKNGKINYNKLLEIFQGWRAYAKWANTYKLGQRLIKQIEDYSPNKISALEVNRLLKFKNNLNNFILT